MRKKTCPERTPSFSKRRLLVFHQIKLRPSQRPLCSICCYQSAVAVWFVARLASIKLAPLPSGSATCGTRDSEYLSWCEFFFHSRGTISQTLWLRRHASAQDVTIMIPGRAWALADVGDGRPRCDEDTARERCRELTSVRQPLR
jgi:hypothetical protein